MKLTLKVLSHLMIKSHLKCKMFIRKYKFQSTYFVCARIKEYFTLTHLSHLMPIFIVLISILGLDIKTIKWDNFYFQNIEIEIKIKTFVTFVVNKHW